LGNSDKYSPTTSKQMGKCHPHDVSKWLSTDQLVQIVNKGGFLQYQLLKEA
jgi:monomeric isocitrate dehydrogenase